MKYPYSICYTEGTSMTNVIEALVLSVLILFFLVGIHLFRRSMEHQMNDSMYLKDIKEIMIDTINDKIIAKGSITSEELVEITQTLSKKSNGVVIELEVTDKLFGIILRKGKQQRHACGYLVPPAYYLENNIKYRVDKWS